MEEVRANIVFKAIGVVDWQRSESPYGYNLGEVLSSLAKEIRRGNEEEAVFWACQLMASGKEAEDWMWAWLINQSIEDVSIADPLALVVVSASKNAYYMLGSGEGEKRLAGANAVVYLARAKKTRYVAEMLEVVWKNIISGRHLEIPDYALDFHVIRGKIMNRGLSHYLMEGAKLVNEEPGLSSKYRDILIEWARR